MTDWIVYIIGGFLAGVATGLVGLSAATIIAPLFVTVLFIDPYIAIGIALASDVLASSLSAFRYIQNKNIQLKTAAVMAVSVVIFTILASYVSSNAKPVNLGIMLNVFVVLLGLRFLVFPVKENNNTTIFKFTKSKFILSVFWGAVIGIISGYFGAGGGLSMLAILTIVLGYDLKTGVGTSVFIMVFTAFVGAATHIIIGGTIWIALVITGISALLGANLASKYANKVNHDVLNKVIGSGLVAFGVVLIIIYL
ncbi:MAG TPA: sulfite exporter TauE/SafE family protein [Candidatus Izemoplasmatales bacterium]|nr:sulfite exporter TauE/SafE family protein [Candidatus Izemoplasmatales bacterium]